MCARQREREREREMTKSMSLAYTDQQLKLRFFLLWEKALSLLLRQAHYVGNHNELVPQFTALATSMIRFGEDKATDGYPWSDWTGKKDMLLT